MSWGERSFFLSGSRAGCRGGGGGAITNGSDLQSWFVLCGSVNKSIFYQAN